jgi:hypothetical protein
MCRLRDLRVVTRRAARACAAVVRKDIAGHSFAVPVVLRSTPAWSARMRSRRGNGLVAMRVNDASSARAAAAREAFAPRERTLRIPSISHRKGRSTMWNKALVRRSKISRYEK